MSHDAVSAKKEEGGNNDGLILLHHVRPRESRAASAINVNEAAQILRQAHLVRHFRVPRGKLDCLLVPCSIVTCNCNAYELTLLRGMHFCLR